MEEIKKICGRYSFGSVAKGAFIKYRNNRKPVKIKISRGVYGVGSHYEETEDVGRE